MGVIDLTTRWTLPITKWTPLRREAPHYSSSHKISFVCSPRVHFALLQPSFGSSPRVADSLYERPRALRSHTVDLVYAPEQLRRARHNEAPTRYVSFEKIRRNGANTAAAEYIYGGMKMTNTRKATLARLVRWTGASKLHNPA